MFFGKKKLIGLDIGTSTIKMAELDVTKKSTTLVSFGMAPTPKEATANGAIVNPELVGEAIRGLLEEIKTKRKLVASALWGSSVIVKKISIPQMDPSLINEQIRWEAEQYIPYDINEVNLEYEVLQSAADAETMDLLLVAAVQESAYRCAETVSVAGLQCVVLDVGGFALANCFKANYGDGLGQTVGLLNIGASASNFVILEDGDVVFCRDIPVGGSTYTVELQKALGMTFEEAEATKLSFSAGEQVPDVTAETVKATHEVVSDEVGGTLDFYLNTSDKTKIDRCFITGGGSKMPGLLQQLGGIMSCEAFDPFAVVDYNKRVFNPAYVHQIREFAGVVIGLGMRGVGEK